jgi:hypothetical protein
MLSVYIRLHMAQKTVLQFNDNNNDEVIPVYAMKTYESIARRILNLSTRWRCTVSFMAQTFYLWEKIPANHRVGGWVDPIDTLDSFEKKKSISPCYLNP